MLQRFPYPPYTHDDILEALKRNVPLLMMVSFVYTCINTVKVITVEKERQLKASNSLIYHTCSTENMCIKTIWSYQIVFKL
jgi:ATP-binding cassette subfamily A (ABC1) protein 3